MQVLLDTHLFLWWLKNDRRLSKQARICIVDADIVYVSSVSIWEAAIKVQLGKLHVAIHDLITAIETEGFVELSMTVKHAAEVVKLPPYHRDLFDRMLIAQAICEPLRLLTLDAELKRYSELIEVV